MRNHRTEGKSGCWVTRALRWPQIVLICCDFGPPTSLEQHCLPDTSWQVVWDTCAQTKHSQRYIRNPRRPTGRATATRHRGGDIPSSPTCCSSIQNFLTDERTCRTAGCKDKYGPDMAGADERCRVRLRYSGTTRAQMFVRE